VFVIANTLKMNTCNGLKKECVRFRCPSCHHTTVSKIQQEHLFKLIDDSYGSPSELAKYLDLGIEMLFYLEEGAFDRKDIQSVVSAIRGIIDVLRLQD
jgi:hypothetical protein